MDVKPIIEKVDKEQLYELVKYIFEDQINTTFRVVQKLYGITSGDVEPLEALRLDEATETIIQVLVNQILIEKEVD